MSGLGGLLLATFVLLAPVPVSVAMARRVAGNGQGVAAMATAVLWCAIQIGVGLLLGLAHLFHLPGLLGAEVLVAAAGLLLIRSAGLPAIPRPSSLDAALGLVLLVCGGVATWRFLAVPPTNFDSIAYHLPAMVRWVQEAHLVVTPELGNAARYPFNWELLGAMVFLPLGSDLWVSVPNLAGWLVMGMAVRSMAERAGASEAAAKVCAVTLMATPTVLSRVEAIQPDIALAGFFLAAMVFVDRARRHGAGADRALALLCLALLTGAKTSGLAYASMVVAFWILPAMLAHRRDHGRWGLLPNPLRPGPLTLVLLAALLLGGTWYLRNWILTGNPIGFLEIRLGDAVVFPGAVTRDDLAPTTLAHIFDPGRGDHWALLGRVAREWLGWPILFLVLGIVGIVRDLPARPHQLCRRILVGLGASLVASALLYWNTPFSGDNGEHGGQLTPWIHVGLRYAYPALACLAVLAAAGATTWRIRGEWLWPVAVVAGLVGAVWTLEASVSAHVAVTGGALAVVVLTMRAPRWAGPAAGLAGLLALSLVAAPDRDAGRERWYGRIDTYLRELPDRQPRMALVGSVRRYPLYGPDWRHRVVGVDPRPDDDARAWIQRLRAAGVPRIVVPTGNRQPWPDQARVLAWIAEHPRVFTPEFDPESVRKDLAVYRFTPPIR